MVASRVDTEELERRLRALIVLGHPFTADDLTHGGELTLDPTRQPNGRQSGLGRMFLRASRLGHIEFRGEVRNSTTPSRNGGLIRVWHPTPAGQRWARD